MLRYYISVHHLDDSLETHVLLELRHVSAGCNVNTATDSLITNCTFQYHDVLRFMCSVSHRQYEGCFSGHVKQ